MPLLTNHVADQKAAECSFLIRNLCAYFGTKIIAREFIPLPNVTEPVLRKVLEWCEHHKNDADIRRYHENDADTGRYRTGDIDEWDQKYFGVNQEMVFELILVRFPFPQHIYYPMPSTFRFAVWLSLASQAANYLEIKPLLDGSCKIVANMIKGKSPDEIRKLYSRGRGADPSGD